MRSIHICRSLAFAALLTSPSAALTSSQATPSPVHAVAVEGDQGVLVGQRWRARLRSETATFTPALGPAASENRDLELSFVAVEIGGETIAELDGETRPTDRGDHVSFTRGAAITERWTPQREGVELSYVFHELPSERGELVVRLRWSSNLPLEQHHLDGARFVAPGLGGVEIGGVTGIDANGREARGDLRLVGDELELVLPASFVNEAALPLVLDPLITPVLDLTGHPFFDFEEGASAVAHVATNDTYFVAYEIVLSALDTDIYGELLDASGAPLVEYVTLEASSAIAGHPSVANDAVKEEFLVAWQQLDGVTGWNIHGRQVDPSDGLATDENLLTGGPGDQVRPLLGGNSLDSPTALLVFEEDGLEIRSAAVHFAPTGPWIAGSLLVNASSTASNVALTPSAGFGRRHLIVWEGKLTSTEGSSRGLQGAVVSDQNQLLFKDTFLGEVSWYGQEFQPSVSGNGYTFFVAFLYDPAGTGTPTGEQVRVHRLEWSGNGLIGDLQFELIEPAFFEIFTSVSCAIVADQVLFVWSSDGVLGHAVGGAAYDRHTLVRCESLDLGLTGPWAEGRDYRISAQTSTGSILENEALITWTSVEEDPLGTIVASDVAATVFHGTTTGGWTELGGGTPHGGRAFAPCAFVGNGDFSVVIREADAFAGGLAILSPDPFDFPCGGGTLRVDPSTASFFGLGFGSGQGTVLVSIPPNPSFLGAQFYLQFATVPFATADCSTFDVNFSSAIKFTVQ